MKTYAGARTIDGVQVTVDGRRLDERYDVERFTSNGFEWGYSGNESRQLALALLMDHLGDEAEALGRCEAFMRHVVANLDNDWELSSAEIAAALREIADGSARGA